jgi:hypothetical protein
MHYVTHQMQKHKFSVTCPNAVFIETAPDPPGSTGMHHLTCRSHPMQKHNFSATCPGAVFMKTVLGPPAHEKYCIDVSCPEALERTT